MNDGQIPKQPRQDKLNGAVQTRHECPLTLLQCRTARLVARGRTNSQIADELRLSARTVSTQIQAIMEKLGLENRVQLAVWSLNHLPQQKC